jgi:hypothetical protein
MKAYVIASGTIFGLLAAAHVLRVFAEGARVATDPLFVAITVAAAGLSVWAFRVVRSVPRS